MEILKTIKFRIVETQTNDGKPLFIPQRFETSIAEPAAVEPAWINIAAPKDFFYRSNYKEALLLVNDFIVENTPKPTIIHDLPDFTMTIPYKK
jgi:hypothetical protein